MIIWPNKEKSCPILLITKPVTQTAENAVNNASTNIIGVVLFVAKGKLNNKPPIKITNKNANIKTWAGFILNHWSKYPKCATLPTRIINNAIWEKNKSKENGKLGIISENNIITARSVGLIKM